MKTALSLVMCSLLLAGCANMQPNAPKKAPEPAQPAEKASEPQDNSTGNLQPVSEEAAPTMGSVRPEPTFRMPTPTARKALLGKWYGIAAAADGGSKEWLIERLNDGTYRIDFRFTAADGLISSQSEVGFWGISEDIYFRIFRGWVMANGMEPADATDPDHYDAYEVLALTKNYFRYRHLGLREIYTVKKMPDHFRLPVVANSQQQSEPLKFEY